MKHHTHTIGGNIMNDEVNAKGKWINVEVVELRNTMFIDWQFIDWHKYNKYVTDNVSATVKKNGVDTKEVPYMIKIARNPNDNVFYPALSKARYALKKLSSETPRENIDVVFNSIVEAGIPLKGRVSLFLSNTGAPICNFTTYDELGFIVKPYVEHKKGTRVMNGILASLTAITRYANLKLEIALEGEHFFNLHVTEDGRAVHGLSLYYDPAVFNANLGREEGLIHLSVAPLGDLTSHRSVGLFNELIKMVDGYDYVIDKNQYEVY